MSVAECGVFEVFGGVRVELDGRDVALPGQQRALLGILLAHRDQPVSTGTIVECLWSEPAPPTADKIVQVVAGRLRRVLEPGLTKGADSKLIVTTTDGYELRPGQTDLDRYEAAAAAARTATPPSAALAHAEAARECWRGRPWGAQADEPWLSDLVSSLEERHRRLEELWSELVLRCGQVEGAIDGLRELAAGEPLREQRWAHLMVGLYRSGRQAEALRAFDEVQAHLRDELGVAPGPELRRLQIAVLQHDPGLARASIDIKATSAVSSFVGRTAELDRLARAVGRDGIVTVVGLGGMGKSRLVDEFAYGQRLAGLRLLRVSMGTLVDAERLPQHVADALGLFTDDAASPLDVLVAAIGSEPTLLVLDGVEQFTAEVGNLALQLMQRCSRLRIVATSRVPLGISVERTIPLGPLPLPGPGEPYDGTALQLMTERGGLDEASLEAGLLDQLRDACASTGGVPLMIELAARSFELGSPEVSLDPQAGLGGVPSHAAVMGAAIEQAMDSIDQAARDLLVRAAALPDGVSEETAASLVSAGPDAVRRSLRQLAWLRLVDTRPGLGSLRFYTLDPVREALTDAQSAAERERDLARAIDTIECVFSSLRPDQTSPVATARLDAAADDHDNLKYLIADRLKVSPRRALELCIAGSEFWPVRGHIVDGRRWIEESMAAAQPDGELDWLAVLALAKTTRTLGEIATMRSSLERILVEIRDQDGEPVLLGLALMYVAVARGWQGDGAGASEAIDEAEVVNRQVGSPWSDAQLDRFRGLELAAKGDLHGARVVQRRFAVRMAELDDPLNSAVGWYLAASLGDMAGMDDVMADLERARALAQIHHDVALLGQLLLLEARTLRRAGDERSRTLLDEAAERLARSGGLRAAALARRDLGLIEIEHDETDDGIGHLRQAFVALIELDRSAASLALGGLAWAAHQLDQDALVGPLASGAAQLRSGGGSPSADDDHRLVAILDQLPFEVTASDLDDADLLDLLEGLD